LIIRGQLSEKFASPLSTNMALTSPPIPCSTPDTSQGILVVNILNGIILGVVIFNASMIYVQTCCTTPAHEEPHKMALSKPQEDPFDIYWEELDQLSMHELHFI